MVCWIPELNILDINVGLSMYLETEKEKISDLFAFIISSIGGIIILSALISISYTQILPLSYMALTIIAILLSIFIGILNEDPKKSILALVTAVVSAVFLTSFMRAMPALIGVIPAETDLFVFAQLTTTLPIFFIITPACFLGNTLGIIINEFLLKPRYAFK